MGTRQDAEYGVWGPKPLQMLWIRCLSDSVYGRCGPSAVHRTIHVEPTTAHFGIAATLTVQMQSELISRANVPVSW